MLNTAGSGKCIDFCLDIYWKVPKIHYVIVIIADVIYNSYKVAYYCVFKQSDRTIGQKVAVMAKQLSGWDLVRIDQNDGKWWQNRVCDENDEVNNHVADFHLTFSIQWKHALGSVESLWCSQFVVAAVQKKELLDLIVCRGEKSNE